MSPAPREERRLRGIALMALALLMFTGIDSCAKWLIQAGLPPFEVVMVRFAVHTALVIALFLPGEGRALVVSASPWITALRGLCLLGGTCFNFFAVKYLPLTLTATIFFTIPLWVCALSVPLLGEHVGPRRWAAVAVGFVGVLIATAPWRAEAHWAVLLSLAAALSAALYGILSRRLAGVDSTATQQLWAAGIALVAVAPVGLADWVWPTGATAWGLFALVGVFGFAGHQLITIAHRLAPAATLAPFVYIQLIYMSGASWIVFGEPPEPRVLVGGAVVLASGLYIWWRERGIETDLRR